MMIYEEKWTIEKFRSLLRKLGLRATPDREIWCRSTNGCKYLLDEASLSFAQYGITEGDELRIT